MDGGRERKRAEREALAVDDLPLFAECMLKFRPIRQRSQAESRSENLIVEWEVSVLQGGEWAAGSRDPRFSRQDTRWWDF